MASREWVKRWDQWVSKEPVKPRTGVYALRDGGFLVRFNNTTKACHTLQTFAEAVAERDRLMRAPLQPIETPASLPLFAEYAAEEFARRKPGFMPSTRKRWEETLKYYLIPAFGAFTVAELHRRNIRHWLTGDVSTWMREGRPCLKQNNKVKAGKAPARIVHPVRETVEGWCRILSTIMDRACKDYDLPGNPAHKIHTEIPHDIDRRLAAVEEAERTGNKRKNPLSEVDFDRWMKHYRTHEPGTFAMMLLGIVTGMRPCHMRPLRRSGPNADISWETGKIVVRRSHTVGKEIGYGSKSRRKGKETQEFTVPMPLLEFMQAHTRKHIPGTKARESDLLFPSKLGTVMPKTAMQKPFARTEKALGLTYHVTPYSLRYTFNDLARLSGVDPIITRSISGHHTVQMQEHYSTARASEQNAAITAVMDRVFGTPHSAPHTKAKQRAPKQPKMPAPAG